MKPRYAQDKNIREVIHDFSGGINHDMAPLIQPNEALQAVNVDLLLGNGFQIRKGSDVINAGNPLTIGTGKILSLYELTRRDHSDNSETRDVATVTRMFFS